MFCACNLSEARLHTLHPVQMSPCLRIRWDSYSQEYDLVLGCSNEQHSDAANRVLVALKLPYLFLSPLFIILHISLRILNYSHNTNYILHSIFNCITFYDMWTQSPLNFLQGLDYTRRAVFELTISDIVAAWHYKQ
jgi:hypothetical protein